MKELIYIASPYNHEDPAVMQHRFEKVAEYTAYRLINNAQVYSPIVHNHYLACNYNLPRSWDFWKRIDYSILRVATSMEVLQLDGWKESHGVAAEIEACAVLGIPVSFVSTALAEMFIGSNN